MSSAYLKFVFALPPMQIPPSHLLETSLIISSTEILNIKGDRMQLAGISNRAGTKSIARTGRVFVA